MVKIAKFQDNISKQNKMTITKILRLKVLGYAFIYLWKIPPLGHLRSVMPFVSTTVPRNESSGNTLLKSCRGRRMECWGKQWCNLLKKLRTSRIPRSLDS